MKTHSYLSGSREGAHLADDKKGENIVVLDIRRLTGISDFFVLVGANSSAHLNALEDHLMLELKKIGFRLIRQEGPRSDAWRVLDYGGFIVHLMHNRARDFYGLERLWQRARRVHWEKALVRERVKVR